MGYCLNRLDEPVLMAVPKPMQNEFGIHYRLESCGSVFLRRGICFSKLMQQLAVFYWRISPAQKAFSFLVPGCLILVTFCEGIGKEVTCERTVNSPMRDLHSKGNN